MNTTQPVPKNSRYTPFTQQHYCCMPTSLQMVMYRHGMPLLPAEEIGYHLGLTVPPEDAHLFYNARVSDTPPPAGYGTQIYNPQYEPNKVFKQLGIPITLSKKLAPQLPDVATLLQELQKVEDTDGDALLCFNHGVIRGEYQPYTGHVVVFDRVVDGQVRIVDASWKHPKWRSVDPTLLLEAMHRHGESNSGGIWLLAVNKSS